MTCCPTHRFQRFFSKNYKSESIHKQLQKTHTLFQIIVTEKWVVHDTLPVIKQELSKQTRSADFFNFQASM